MIFGQKFNFFFTLVFFKIGLGMLFNVVVDTREGFPDYKNFIFIYCQTSPYGHLYNTDSSFCPRNAKNHTFPTSIIRPPL